MYSRNYARKPTPEAFLWINPWKTPPNLITSSSLKMVAFIMTSITDRRGLAVMALVVTSTLGAPRAEWPQDQDALEVNEVWAPGPSPGPSKHLDRFSFKTLIKTLVRFNVPAKSQLETAEATISPDSVSSQEFLDPSVSPEDLPGDAFLDVASEDLLDIPTPAPLEEDALNIKPIVKPDKSYRFTHNFRFGYGALPGLP